MTNSLEHNLGETLECIEFCFMIKPILTVWEGSTRKYKPEDGSTSPTAVRAGAECLYFPVLPDPDS